MNWTVRIQEAPEAAGRRIIAVSDIHGHAARLQRLLEKVAFSPEDVLVIVGDILERGPQSLETMRLVMKLARGGNVYPLIGNVDEWALIKALELDADGLARDAAAFLGWHGGSLIDDFARELGIEISPEMDAAAFRAAAEAHFAPEYAFMRALPTILRTPQATFVHGGLPAGPIEPHQGMPSRRLTKWDAYMDAGIVRDTWTIVGHWPVCLYDAGTLRFSPVACSKQRTIAIDGGCGIKGEGQLNALLIEDGRFAWTACDELPAARALDVQAASDEWGAITYMNGAVDVLAEEDDMAHVRHRPTGRAMWVPAGRLFERDGERRCNDITDYRLPVAPGELLRVLWRTSRGVVCKKDGIEGWYMGRLEETDRAELEAAERARGPLPLEV